jgi:hypothetical protein
LRPFDPKSYLVDVLGPYASGSRSDTPDLFERYLLEAGDSDDDAIATRLADVKALWDRRIEHPKYGPLIRTLSSKHLEAELTLCDSGERERLAVEAATREDERIKQNAKALANWRRLVAEHVAARGGLDPAQRGQLGRLATKQGLDPALVERELDKVPVAKMPEVLDAGHRQRVRKALSDLARDMGEPRLGLSLYHALGLEVTQDGGLVQERYEHTARENDGRRMGTTATLFKTVLAQVKLLLIDADSRAYIEGLVLDVKEEMEFQGVAAASDNVIDPAEAEQLLRSAIELGLTAELGQRVVRELAKENGVSIQTGGAIDYVACPSCNRPHPREGAPESCSRCATALFVVCPGDGCNTRNDATSSRCSSCGLDLHSYTEATRRLAALNGALTAGRVAWAAGELAEIARVLGDDKVPTDVRRAVEDADRAAGAQWATIESAIGERRLFAARTALRKLRKEAGDVTGPSGDHPSVRLEEVERRLAELDAALARARGASGSARERALVDALGLAADCAEAATALNAIAPQPADRVDVAMGPRGPVLTWQASPTIAARYAVQRTDVRSGARDELGETTNTSFDDGDAASGALVCYEVTTIRSDSRSPASASPALIVARELDGLSLADGDGEVRMTWPPVPSSARVLVFRQNATGGREQELVADRSGLVDRTVENGQRYRYRIIVEYSGDGAQTQRTRGLTVFGQPAPPPEGIDELTVRALPDGVMVEFAPPPVGSIAVLRCTEEPKVELGEAVDPQRLADFGRVLATEGRGARDTTAGGICWYLPVTIAGGAAVAGRARRHLALTDIANVKAVQHAREVRVTWAWPDGVRLAKVIWRHDRQPEGPDDAAAESAWMRLGEYRDHGGFTIDAPGSKPVFIAVVPGIRVDDTLLAGTTIPRAARAAIRPTATIDLRYSIRRAGMRKKRLEVRVDVPAGSEPPGLVLVVRTGDLLPRHASDGEVIARLGGGEPLTSTIDLSGRPRPLAVRLFLGTSAASSGYQLFDPAPDDLMIS